MLLGSGTPVAAGDGVSRATSSPWRSARARAWSPATTGSAASQRARDLRLVRAEASQRVGDRRALVELERVQRRGGEPGEPGAEADADLHTARAYAAPGRIATSAQRVLADVVRRGPLGRVRPLVDERLLAGRVVEQRARHADELLGVVDLARRVVVARVGDRDLLEEPGAASRLSFRSTPTNATCLPMSSETRCITGISARHGPHQAAQMFTTAGWPRSAASRVCRPLRAPGRISFAWLCSAASAGGAPSRRCRISPAVSVVALGGVAVSFDASETPRTRTTTSPTAPTPSASLPADTGEECHTGT